VTRTEVIVSTNDPDKVTVWMGASGATDLTQEAAEDLAALLMRAVRQLQGLGCWADGLGRVHP
jgi:hypothetical protein